MKIYRTEHGIVLEYSQQYYLCEQTDWDTFINRDSLYIKLLEDIQKLSPVAEAATWVRENNLPPISKQEIWGAEATYYRSREGRMEESQGTGSGSFYEMVYDAERPELFFKATAARTVGSGDWVNIRKDSTWNVPEPELTLFVTSRGKIVAYTIGNDISARSIEGENPLYLPQAKLYERCAGLGPCLFVPEKPIEGNTRIQMEILRDGKVEFAGYTTVDRIKRKQEVLVEFLYRECIFEYGCFLMTGAGVVPPTEFTLFSNDEIRITIDQIGTLTNWVN
jgi:2-dehydro-3-deoxy-D-arabinonate dehydratase